MIYFIIYLYWKRFVPSSAVLRLTCVAGDVPRRPAHVPWPRHPRRGAQAEQQTVTGSDGYAEGGDEDAVEEAQRGYASRSECSLLRSL
jgi:hypothetical protein